MNMLQGYTININLLLHAELDPTISHYLYSGGEGNN